MRRIASARSAECILGCFLPAADRDALLGDLIEEHALRGRSESMPNETRWYWNQILRSVVPLVWVAVRRGRWLEILGAAVAAYLLQSVIQSASAIAMSKLLVAGPIAYGVITLTVALGTMIFGGYIAARMRRGAAALLAVISAIMVVQWMATAGAGTPLTYQLMFLVSCPLSAVVGGALLRRRDHARPTRP